MTRHIPEALHRGRTRFGPQVDRVVLLPPVRVDAALLAALDGHLRGQGLRPSDLVRVDVAYVLDAGSLYCDVLAVGLRRGVDRPVELRIELGVVTT